MFSFPPSVTPWAFKRSATSFGMLLETEPAVCAAVPGGWGARGWTSLYFVDADEELIRQSLETAWRNAAPKSLVRKNGGH